MPNAVAPALIASAEPPISVEHVGHEVAESHVTLPATRLPVEARGLALGILATLATVFALSWAQAFLVPLLLGIVIAYTLNPVVAWLEGARIPRAAGTVVVMAAVTLQWFSAPTRCAARCRPSSSSCPKRRPSSRLHWLVFAKARTTPCRRSRTLPPRWKPRRLMLPVAPWLRASLPLASSWRRPSSDSATTCGRVRWARSEPLDRRRWSSSWCSSCCSVATPSSES